MMKITIFIILVALFVSAIGCNQRMDNSSDQPQVVSDTTLDSSMSKPKDLSQEVQTEDATASDVSVDSKEDPQADNIAIDDLVHEEFTIDIINEMGDSVGRTDTITLGIPIAWSTEDDHLLTGIDSANFYTTDGTRTMSIITSRLATAIEGYMDPAYLQAISSEELTVNGIPSRLYVSEEPVYKDGEEVGTDFLYAYYLKIDDHYLCILYFMAEHSDSARALTGNLISTFTLKQS